MPATRTPAATSSQKWLPVAITANQTHGAQASQSTFAHRRRTTVAMTTLTIVASSACRLGIAAYGLEAKATKVEEWLTVECAASVSVNPASGNIRGGAVGSRT